MSKTAFKNEHIKKAAYDMLYLAGCGIKGIVPEKGKVDAMDFPIVRAMSRRHSLSAITCMALEPLFPDKTEWSDTFKKWQDDKNKAVRKELLMNAERNQLVSFMEEKGIWYSLRKGIILKEFYPKTGQRQMSDNDILYDKTYQNEICEWFKARGYTVVTVGEGRDDVYHKEPIYNFEMSVDLFEERLGHTLTRYYKNVKEKLLPQEGTKYGFRFTDEDFYIYFIAHAYMHDTKSYGTGLRTLLDCYVFLNAKNDALDWNYIYEELKKLDMAEFEKQIREIAFKVFSEPKAFSPDALSDEYKKRLEHFLLDYGMEKTAIKNSISGLKKHDEEAQWKSKLRYIHKRIFPPMAYYKKNYPFLYRSKIFIPFFVIYRLICKPFAHRKYLNEELRCLAKKDEKDE